MKRRCRLCGNFYEDETSSFSMDDYICPVCQTSFDDFTTTDLEAARIGDEDVLPESEKKKKKGIRW